MTHAILNAIEVLKELKEADRSYNWAKPKVNQYALQRAVHLATLQVDALELANINDAPIRFTVKGHGIFPADQLRHDRCWPVDGDLNRVTDPTVRLGEEKNVTVTLCAQSRRHITPQRWASFGWTVTEIDGCPVVWENGRPIY